MSRELHDVSPVLFDRMAYHPICPECNLRRSPLEFQAFEKELKHVNCRNCRDSGASQRKVRR